MSEGLKIIAEDFAKHNPRYMDYGIKFIDYALKSRGWSLTPTEIQTFLYHLTGHKINIETIKEHLSTDTNQKEVSK